MHGPRHVRLDQTGSDLIDPDSLLGQANAKSWATMLSPALATQYSGRLTLANVLETDVMKTIWARRRFAPLSSSMAVPRLGSRKTVRAGWWPERGPSFREWFPADRARVAGATPALLTQRSTRPKLIEGFSSSRRPLVEVCHVGLERQSAGSAQRLGLGGSTPGPSRRRIGNSRRRKTQVPPVPDDPPADSAPSSGHHRNRF